MFRGLTALFAIVIVGALGFPSPGEGVGVGDVPTPLFDPPPHAGTTSANAIAAANSRNNFFLRASITSVSVSEQQPDSPAEMQAARVRFDRTTDA